jgi:riboflavin biosynthesis pyrimidine reductase
VNLYRVIPGPAKPIPFDTPEERQALAVEFSPPHTPWIRAVMVANSAGETRGPTGTSAGLTRGADRALLDLYREVADVVLVGASTVRAERVPTPRTSALAIVSSSGDLSGHQLVVGEGALVCVITSPPGAQRLAHTLFDVPHTVCVIDSPAPFGHQDILSALAGWCSTTHVLVEGGVALWNTFAAVTNELALAVTPPPLDQHGGIPAWWPGDRSEWSVASLLSDDEKMLYYRHLTGVRGAP